MGEPKTVRFDANQEDALQDLVERGKAPNESEAHRMLINAGMAQYGYSAGQNGNTTLKWMSKELARLFSYVGLGWIAFFWAFPVEFRLIGVTILFMALGMIGAYLALEKYEPRVSHAIFGKGEKA